LATIRKFEDLEIWQLARQLSQQVLFISKNTELKNDYRFKDQIKASSGSVMDNIAEGYERDGNVEFRQYLSIAKGSFGEVRSQCYRLFDSEYIAEEKMVELVTECEQISKRIANFISYLNKKDFKGNKFK